LRVTYLNDCRFHDYIVITFEKDVNKVVFVVV